MRTKEEIIIEIFRCFKDQHLEYVVLRNFENIPKGCSMKNDIDILVHKQSVVLANSIFQRYGFEKDVDEGFYSYNTKPHQHFYLQDKDIHFDMVDGLYYRSINNIRQWIPIHLRLQRQIFETKIFDQDAPWFYMPSNLDQFLHLICHCIFDKRTIKRQYASKIETLFSKLNLPEVFDCIKLVFFRFSNELIDIIKNKQTDTLYEKYITFRGY